MDIMRQTACLVFTLSWMTAMFSFLNAWRWVVYQAVWLEGQLFHKRVMPGAISSIGASVVQQEVFLSSGCPCLIVCHKFSSLFHHNEFTRNLNYILFYDVLLSELENLCEPLSPFLYCFVFNFGKNFVPVNDLKPPDHCKAVLSFMFSFCAML